MSIALNSATSGDHSCTMNHEEIKRRVTDTFALQKKVEVHRTADLIEKQIEIKKKEQYQLYVERKQ